MVSCSQSILAWFFKPSYHCAVFLCTSFTLSGFGSKLLNTWVFKVAKSSSSESCSFPGWLSICPTVSGLILLKVLNTFWIALNWGFDSFCSCNKGVIKASVLIVLFLVFPLDLEVNGAN